MTTDDIIKMAKEYADEVTNGYGVVTYEFDLYGLEKFALLIRAAERERIIAANAPEIEKLNVYIKALEDAVAAERERLAQPEQEPAVKWDASAPLVTHPHPAFQATQPQPDLAKVGEVGVWGERQWQGLTDEEIDETAWPYFIGNIMPSVKIIVRQLEAKLKEKNT